MLCCAIQRPTTPAKYKLRVSYDSIMEELRNEMKRHEMKRNEMKLFLLGHMNTFAR